MRIFHVIVGLNVGGAELMLKRLVEYLNGNPSHCQVVVSLTNIGDIGAQLQARGITVHALGMRSPFNTPFAFWRLVQLLRVERPDVVQTWMYHADLIGGLAARIVGNCSIVWCIRSTAIPQGALSISFWLVRLCAFLSHFIPDKIICCANAAKTSHLKFLYSKNKIIVIPNGYNFSPLEDNALLSQKARCKLGVKNEEIVIGVVGRFDPLKDFHNFVSAAALVVAQRSDVKFLMVGRGNEWSNMTLRRWIENAGLIDNFYLVGQQTDVAYFLSAMDIFCLSSVKEAFPNVVVEAMAMGLPCVVTQAGDAADILGDDKFVVSVSDSISLAHSLLKVCQLDSSNRKHIGHRNAKRVREKYAIDGISQNYVDVYYGVKK